MRIKARVISIDKLEEDAHNFFKGKGNYPALDLEVEPYCFRVRLYTRPLMLMLSWGGLTEAPNVLWNKSIFLCFSKPYKQRNEYFTSCAQDFLPPRDYDSD